MPRAPIIAGLFAIALLSPAFAFDQCSAGASDPDRLRREIRDHALHQTPVKYGAIARSIDVVTAGFGGRLLPFAVDRQGAKVVVFPPPFSKILCQFVLTEYLLLEDVPRGPFDQAAEKFGSCIKAGGAAGPCLTSLGTELDAAYRKTFLALTRNEQEVAYGVWEAARDQIVMHEYAHHFFHHFDRIHAGELARPDAEFAADLFAMLNGVQAGQPISAMYYFFAEFAVVEQGGMPSNPDDYESGTCRAGNVAAISGFIGFAPIELLHAANPENAPKSSPETLDSIGKTYFDRQPAMVAGACGRIQKVALGVAYDELKRLYRRSQQDVDLLFSGAKSVDVDRVRRLIRDLVSIAESSEYMNGLAARTLALILHRWGRVGRPLAPLTREIDRLVNTAAVYGNFMPDDLGLLLNAQGISILYERVDLGREKRLELAQAALQRAVEYGPAISASWANLALISAVRGDCKAAARFQTSAVATITETKETEDLAKRALQLFQAAATDEAVCRKATDAAAHLFPGFE